MTNQEAQTIADRYRTACQEPPEASPGLLLSVFTTTGNGAGNPFQL